MAHNKKIKSPAGAGWDAYTWAASHYSPRACAPYLKVMRRCHFSCVQYAGSRLGQGSFNRLYLCLPFSVFRNTLSTLVRFSPVTPAIGSTIFSASSQFKLQCYHLAFRSRLFYCNCYYFNQQFVVAGGGGKAAWGRCLARITNKCWGHKHAGSASQFSPRVCAAKLGRYAPLSFLMCLVRRQQVRARQFQQVVSVPTVFSFQKYFINACSFQPGNASNWQHNFLSQLTVQAVVLSSGFSFKVVLL